MTKMWRMRALAALAAVSVLCGAAYAIELHADDTVNITGEYDQLILAAGEDVSLNMTATDDTIATGGNIVADGASMDHAFFAGGDISFNNSTAHDLFAGGGEIDVVGGEIVDDMIAAGGRITLGPEARIGGDVVIAGGTLRIDSPIGGGVRAAGSRITLSGVVNGDVYLDGGSITIGPDAHIMGALTHRGRSVSISPSAQIDGEVTVLRPRPEPDLRPLKTFAAWMAATIVFGMFLMAINIAGLLPRLMNGAASAVRQRPLSMLGLGLVVVILAPVLAAILMVTVVGIPLSFALIATLAFTWPLAVVAAAYALGMLARKLARMDASGEPGAGARVLWAGVAMIVLILLGFIPVIGSLMWLLLYLLGLGAVIAEGWRALAKRDAPAP